MTIEMPPALADFLDSTHQSIVIGEERRDARSGKTIDVRDPGTGEVIGQIAAGEADDVDLAVSEARRPSRRSGATPSRRPGSGPCSAWPKNVLYGKDARNGPTPDDAN